jgi:hypothetical protein
MNLYTHFSPTHTDFYEHFFKPSLRALYSKNELKIRMLSHEQHGSGIFMEQGWKETMELKLDILKQAVNENRGKYFIFSDVDIQFFKPFVDTLEERIKDNDFVAQEDNGGLNTGFFICRGNDTMYNMFSFLRNNLHINSCEQSVLNMYRSNIKYDFLPKNEFYTIGNYFVNKNGTNEWDGESKFVIPLDTIKMHHANYVIGKKNKIKLMNIVKQRVRDATKE